jgi:hypothetical protein
MTLDELEASATPPPTPEGCEVHPAYDYRTCEKGTNSCGVMHTPPAVIKRKWQNAREAMKDRETMALKGMCYHCAGTMQELKSVLRMPGVRYFVCTINKSHSVCIIPKDV